ncbi:helix-turn-helix domain-containing protein [Verrucosispora sp. WMMA2044]|uniref:helix-turn-helix domain-containing protein n=1 Tax=Verrucosispora sp. WMMA2044 TaxID=3016419 RepID=UPI00248ABB21|nr:helix-turn-helix domain-containing protein [Verrucosispora sp. WMMA2044]WBB47699.1 helix-turn-helix domain-containing protein [Verrucosispora sp. WMMA2044]
MTAFDATEVRRLRTEEQLSVREIRARTGLGRNRIHELLRGVPAPERTRRPRAKDDLRTEAVALRSTGHPVPEIARRLGVSRSTAYLWVRHIPLKRDPEEERERRRAHSKVMTDAQWEEHRRIRDAARAATVDAAAAWVKGLRYRDLVLVGAALYWAEGTKAKPWRPHDCRVRFVNSDPALVALFVEFVEALGERRAALRYRVAIHESADAAEAVNWWAGQIGVPAEAFQPSTMKRHRPTTVRRNTGTTYRGCLSVEVPRSRRLYWKIEGIMKGMADGIGTAGR